MPPPSNILIYRLGSLGDTVIALPCFHLIRKKFPHSKIIILTNQPVSGKAAAAMAVLENSGLCDEAISYPVGMRNLGELAALRKKLRRVRPAVLINLAAARGRFKSLRDHLFFRSCGIKNIVGTPFRKKDLQLQQTADGSFEAESQRLASRLASLGSVNLADRSLWDLKLSPAERKQALALLPAGRNDFIAVSIGTKLPANDWGTANFERLLALLSRELPDATLVLLGALDEWERSEKLGRAWASAYVNLCGKTSPRVSAAVLEHCRLFIGHDSGPMHLAGAAGVPTLGLFSWFNPPGQWFPGHRSWRTIKVLNPALPEGGWKPELRLKQSATEGIWLLKPEDVFRSAMELLQANSKTTA
jgi:ADP-heptose:LPS heptosyltransferase